MWQFVLAIPRYLNSLSGAIIGLLLYSLKSLVINFLLGLVSFPIALLIFLIIPVLVTLICNITYNMNILASIAMAIVATTIALVIIPVLLGYILARVAWGALTDFFRESIHGASDGFEKGIFHVLKVVLLGSWLEINPLLQWILSSNNNSISLPPMQERDSSYFPGPEPMTIDNYSLLTSEEIRLASSLPTLSMVLDRYNDLAQRIEKLDRALEMRDAKKQLPKNWVEEEKGMAPAFAEQSENSELEGIDDEVIVDNGLIRPALLMKQYQTSPQSEWIVVPTSTKIVDTDSWSRWLNTKNDSHPLFKDSIQNPQSYATKKTRYAIYPYPKPGHCQELHEAALSIRATLATIRPKTSHQPFKINELIVHSVFGSPVEPLNLGPGYDKTIVNQDSTEVSDYLGPLENREDEDRPLWYLYL